MGEITVTVTRSQETLTMSPRNIDLREGDWVRWEFEDLAEDEFGFISFAPPLSRLGPFHSLRSFGQAGLPSMLGKGNKGSARLFDYQALVLHPQDGAARASGTGTINNLATVRDTAPEITVAYKKDEEDGKIVKQWLEVSPNEVGLNTGDTATWFFRDLPADAFACFQFEPLTAPASGAPRLKEAFGPFIAFQACLGDGPDGVWASATGFAVDLPQNFPPEERGRFTYHIQLRRWNGELIALHDPMIDNLGPPVPLSETREQ